ncbi:hypothetical protein SAMN04490194_4982 [Pseudomonas migulae]|uniref:Uncharacterized protein n=1 Tax=Pseudomonas migulae TaxID=78543 RepID=A0A1H5MSM5_9PSED|nr:hypothetical protein FBY04_12226 [Pseudomonas sp. SJZ080]SEE91368.1 hypothetical protein SAMN04490194_4982 [Pseudomonas migulae]
MTLHQYRAILGGVLNGEKSYKTKTIHLLKSRFYRDVRLNFVIYRVKFSDVSFLYCTPR